jgi:hypothetical protein
MEETMMVDLNATLERLAAAAEALERAVARQNEVAVEAQQSVARIVAEAESNQVIELTRRLGEAEAKIASLTSSASRKTLSPGTATMLTKQGVDMGAVSLDAGAVDGALAHLSVEQRIAVKAELMRAGLLG